MDLFLKMSMIDILVIVNLGRGGGEVRVWRKRESEKWLVLNDVVDLQGECLLETQEAILDKFLQKFMRIPKKEEQDGIKLEDEEEEQEEEEEAKGETPGMSDKGETSGMSDKGETPGMSDKGETPGMSDKGETPGMSDKGETPGMSDKGEMPCVSVTVVWVGRVVEAGS